MIKLYNTMSRSVDELKPIEQSKVSVYTCGPTVYDYPHIGNWFTFIRYDVLIRTLKAANLNPGWVMNITDVGHLVSDADEGEDKLEKGARREGKTAWDVAKFYGDYFVEALKRLNFAIPDHLPKATDLIQDQIDLVKKLETKGYIYTIDDGVYFDTSKLSDYGKLARLKIDELKAGARVEYNKQKRNPTDFALWKFSPKGEKRDMEWWSPWKRSDDESNEKHVIGAPRIVHRVSGIESHSLNQTDTVRGSWGFPGWHLECSAMAMKYLGETIDIHGGGIDHIPVHHTNEIAQSEAVTGKPFANYWFHANFILIDGKKMSKSAGNFYTLEDIEKKGYDLMAFRLLVLESHYRTEANFSWENLKSAQNRLNSLRAFADLRFNTEIYKAGSDTHPVQGLELDGAWADITISLYDDLNTPAALERLSRLQKQTETRGIDNNAANSFKKLLNNLDSVFGLGLLASDDINQELRGIMEDRQKARDANDFKRSDELRNKLKEQGIEVKDTPHGQIWSRS